MSTLINKIKKLEKNNADKAAKDTQAWVFRCIKEMASTGGFFFQAGRDTTGVIRTAVRAKGYRVQLREDGDFDWETGRAISKWMAVDVYWDLVEDGTEAAETHKLAQEKKDEIIKKFRGTELPRIERAITKQIKSGNIRKKIEWPLSLIDVLELEKEGLKAEITE